MSEDPKGAARPRYGLGVRKGATQHPFDREHGVDTSGLVTGRHLPVGHPHDRYNTAYYGTAPSLFNALIARWQESTERAALENYSFVDVGAGKGRVLLMASQSPFKQVVGVELHPRLVSTARRNIRAWNETKRARSPISIVCADALEFTFPAGPCLVYLFHPFAAPVLRRLLRHIEQSRSDSDATTDILYVNAEHDAVFARRAGFILQWKETIAMCPEEAAAERFIVTEESDGEYASTGSELCSAWRWSGKSKNARSRVRISSKSDALEPRSGR